MNRTTSRLLSIGLIAVAATAAGAQQTTAVTMPTMSKGSMPLAAIGNLSDMFRASPGTSGGSPTAFGPGLGDIWVGGAYMERIRRTYLGNNTYSADPLRDDGVVSFGFGLGNATKGLALGTTVSNFSPYRLGVGNHTTISIQFSRHLDSTMAIAVGGENAFVSGGGDNQDSYYGAVSKIFWSPFEGATWLKSVTVTGGVGNGRFRTLDQVFKNEETVGVFASVGLLVHDQVNLIGDWTGQDLNLGATIVPFKRFPLALTPTITEVLQQANSSARFVISAGLGWHF